MSTDYKEKNDTPDLYKILGLTSAVCTESNCDKIIKKAYLKRAKACHPDKHPDNQEISEIFQLVTMAYDVIKDEKGRIAYNNKLSIKKQTTGDFSHLKKHTDNYMKSIGEYMPPTDQQKLSFREQMNQMNLKQGYDTTKTDAIPMHDANKLINNMKQSRSTQDRDLMPENLFKDGIDLKKFHAVFDQVHDREKNNGSVGTIQLHTGTPSAWNDDNSGSNFSSFDSMDNLYGTGASGNYSSTDFGTPMAKLSAEDIANIRGADYVNGHNDLNDDYYKDMAAVLRSRDSESKSFESMKYGDFKRDDTAGYGIFDKIGINIDNRLTFDVDDDEISKKFDRLMAEKERGSNSSSGPSQQKSKIAFDSR